MILALDMARKTGWATSDGKSGVHDFGFHPDERMGHKLQRVRNWLDENFVCTDLLVYEQAHQRGGAATRQAIGMQSVAEMYATAIGAKVVAVHTGTLKKHATGSGNAGKPQMIGAARKKWPGRRFADDNEVDAVWLLDYVQAITPDTEASDA